MMSIKHLARVGFWIVIASVVAVGQQRDNSAGPGSKAPAEGAVTRTNQDGSGTPSRRVETRRESGGREVRTETVETPDSEGRLKPAGETVTETSRRTPNVTRTKRDVFDIAPGQRTLLETVESEQEVRPDGSSRTVESTWTPDSGGRLGLTSRQVEETKSSADTKQTDTAIFQPGVGAALQESERIQKMERQVRPDLLRTSITRSVRDANGRFQRTEETVQEVRTIGPSQYLEEETVQRLDSDGKLTLSERNVIRRSVANGQDQTVKETFSRNLSGALMRSDNRPELSQRVRTTTTTTADGGGQTVEEVEARNPVSPNEPMKMVRRTVETLRKVTADRWQTERQVFVRDVNGRWVVATSETGQQSGR
jgi:hypothetical protein